MTPDPDNAQTAAVKYDPALIARASGFEEVVQEPRVFSFEPLDLDLDELPHAPLEESPAFDTEPGIGPVPGARAAAEPAPASAPGIPLYEGTLVLPASALPIPTADQTLVLPVEPARALEHTLVIAVPSPMVHPAAEARGESGAATRIVPLEDWAPAGVAASVEALGEQRAEPPAPAAAQGRDWLGRWRALPIPRRISLVLAPFALLAVLKMMLLPRPGMEEPDSAPAAAPTSAALQAARPATAPVPNAPQPPPKNVAAPVTKGKTLQRAAADAMAEGNTALALGLYKKLAAAEPNVPAYRAAVRILQDRARAERAP